MERTWKTSSPCLWCVARVLYSSQQICRVRYRSTQPVHASCKQGHLHLGEIVVLHIVNCRWGDFCSHMTMYNSDWTKGLPIGVREGEDGKRGRQKIMIRQLHNVRGFEILAIFVRHCIGVGLGSCDRCAETGVRSRNADATFLSLPQQRITQMNIDGRP